MVAQVDGWECVVSKDEFNIGDCIVYIEIDSIMPERPEFEFLRSRKFRVRTIKLKGQVSQGLVLPLSVLPDGNYFDGQDVTEILGVKKYDPQADKEAALLVHQPKRKQSRLTRFLMRFGWFRKYYGQSKTSVAFPSWIQKTDETRVQNMTSRFEYERISGTEFSVTEKLDGQSATYYLRRRPWGGYEFGVCSRNIHLTVPDNSSYWTIAKKYVMANALRQLINGQDYVVLQGEICGPGIQGNKYRLDSYEFFAFNLIYPSGKCSTSEIQSALQPFGLKTVPLLETSYYLPDSIAELVEQSKGDSVVLPGLQREGLVLRNKFNTISFKVINPDFLLAEKE